MAVPLSPSHFHEHAKSPSAPALLAFSVHFAETKREAGRLDRQVTPLQPHSAEGQGKLDVQLHVIRLFGITWYEALYKMKRSYEAAMTSSSGKNWSTLPDDVVSKILEKLSFVDCLNAILTCKGWKIQIPANSRCFLPWIIEQDWSMMTVSSSKQYLSCKLKLHQPLSPQPYSTASTTFHLPCTTSSSGDGKSIPPFVPLVRDTKLGWILMEIYSTGLLVLYNTQARVLVLPPLMSSSKFIYRAAFTCPPTSSDCVVFAVTQEPGKLFATIHTWCPGDSVWKQHTGPDRMSCMHRYHSAVAMGRTLYCLEVVGDGSMPMFVFSSTNSALKTVGSSFGRGQEGYLAGVDGGQVLLVVCTMSTKSFELYMYDMAADSWVPKRRLDGLALFLDRRHHCAYAAPASPMQMDNRVYLGFSKSGETYYCLEDGEMKSESSGRFMFPSYDHKKKPYLREDIFIALV